MQMEDETSTHFSNADLMDEVECTSPDVIQIDTNVNELVWNDQSLMPALNLEENTSEQNLLSAMEQFLHGFVDRYSTPGPPFYMGSLEQALAHSLFDSTNPCPLVLFIYHSQSVATNVFCEHVICADKITNCLAENFIVWPWDRTKDANYQRLLTMLHTHLGDEVVETIASSPINAHPMLVCLEFSEGHVEVIDVIRGFESSDEALTLLMRARARFDCRIEAPDSIDLFLTAVSNEGWSMSPSRLTSIERTSEEFRKTANQFVGNTERIFSIKKIENSLWFFQYHNHKNNIDARLKNVESERLLVFHCSQPMAEQILRSGFKDHQKSPQGRIHGHGFYFSLPSPSIRSDTSSDNEQRVILVCRVLVGRTCLGHSTMETCPDRYDSTTDGLDTYIVYSNRSILPKYYIKYS